MSTNIKQFITNLDSKMATLDKIMNEKKKYNECNKTLPTNLPYITREECQKAYSLLVKKFGKKQTRHSYKDEWVKRKMAVRKTRPFGSKTWNIYTRKCWVCLSGDASQLHNGWRRLIHDVSHMVHRWLRPTTPNHCFHQAELELAMIKYVQEKDWLNGVLKPKVVILSKDEKRLKKLEHYQKLIGKWQTKLKLANTFIRKYNKKVKYLNKN